MGAAAFFDTNVPLYLLSADAIKADRAEALLAEGGTISVQVLNEFVAVARRKQDVSWQAIEETLSALRHVCRVEPLTVEIHDRALVLAKRHGFPIYDAYIAASALLAGCTTLYTEDFQNKRKLGDLTIVNPFA